MTEFAGVPCRSRLHPRRIATAVQSATALLPADGRSRPVNGGSDLTQSSARGTHPGDLVPVIPRQMAMRSHGNTLFGLDSQPVAPVEGGALRAVAQAMP